MKNKVPNQINKKGKYSDLLIQTLLIILGMAICMTLFQQVRENFTENLPHWQLHTVEIVFSFTLASIVVVSLVFPQIKKKKELAKLLEEHNEIEGKYKHLVEGTANLVTRVDNEGKYLYVNPAFESIYGIKTENCIGKLAMDFVHPEDREMTLEAFHGWIDDGTEDITFENRLLNSCGEVQHMLWTCKVQYDESGEVAWIDSIARDITEYKNAENALKIAHDELEERVQNRTKELATAVETLESEIVEHEKAKDALTQSEKTYRTLLENIPQKIFYKDANSVYISCNKNYADDLGTTPKDISGKTDFDFHPKDLAEKYRDDDNLIIKSGQRKELDEKYLKNGQEFIVQTIKTPVADGEGNIIGVLGIFWDITERKRVEQELEKERRFSAAVIDAIPGTFYVWSEEGNIVRWNKVHETLYGYTRDEVSRMRIEDWFDEDEIDVVRDTIRTCFEEGESHIEVHALTKDGLRLPTYFTTHRLDVGDQRYMVGVGLDITERKRAEEELDKYRQRLEELVKRRTNELVRVNEELKQEIVDHEKSEDKLNEESKKQKILLDNLPCIAMILKMGTREIVASNKLAQELGAFPGEFCYEKCSQRDDPCPWCLAPELWATNEPKKIEIDYKGSNYEGVWVPLSDDLYVHYIFDITERKQVEESLKIHQYYLEKAQEIGSIGTWELDIAKNELKWTDENYRVFGVAIGTPLTYEIFLDCIHPDDREYVDREWTAAINGKPYDIEHRLIADGKVKWVREKAELNFDENGNCIYAIGFTQDITERKQAEEFLNESEDKFSKVFHSNPNLMQIIDLETMRRIEVNDSFTQITGYTSQEAVGSSIGELCVQVDYKRALRAFESLAEKGSIRDFESTILTKEGQERSLIFNGEILEIQGRDFALVIAQDITERKQAEEESRINQVRLEVLDELSQLVNKSDNEIKDFALQGSVRATESAIGYLYFMNADETVLTLHSWSKDVMPRCTMLDKPTVYKVDETGLWGEAAHQRKPVITNDYESNPIRRGYPEGHVPIKRHMNIPLIRNGKIVLIAGVGNKENEYNDLDVKQLTLIMDRMWTMLAKRRAEGQLQQRQAELLHMSRLSTIGEMASGLAHELNQPLCAAMNYANACLHRTKSGDVDMDKLVEDIQAAVKQTERAGEIINGIKNFVRKREFHKSTVDINELVAGLSNLINADIRRGNVKLNMELGEQLPMVLADHVQIEQVLLNLMLNGIDAMCFTDVDRRILTVRTTYIDNAIQVAVCDTGKGLADGISEKMFNSFFTTKPKGMGIGLSISRSIIETHNGNLSAETNADGGATIIFSLPINKANV